MEKTHKDPNVTTWQGTLKTSVRVAGRVTLTLGLIAMAATAVRFGAANLTRRAEAMTVAQAAPAIPVLARPVIWQEGFEIGRGFVGQIEPRRTVDLSFELSGRLAAIGPEEGAYVAWGDTLAALDTALLEAEQAQLRAAKSTAEAQLTFAVQTLERNEALKARGFATQARSDRALADRDALIGRIAEIEAGLDATAIRIAKSRLTAPFDGRVTHRIVDGGEALGPGQPVLTLIDLASPKLRVGVPLDLRLPDIRSAQIEIDGRILPAELETLRPDIDPVTRTRTAIFTLPDADGTVFGQTARLLVSEHVDARGFWVPVTSLREGARGQWTVLAVAADQIVRAAPVEILHATAKRVYVRGGIPADARLIIAGPHRVTVGQSVVAQTRQ